MKDTAVSEHDNRPTRGMLDRLAKAVFFPTRSQEEASADLNSI